MAYYPETKRRLLTEIFLSNVKEIDGKEEREFVKIIFFSNMIAIINAKLPPFECPNLKSEARLRTSFQNMSSFPAYKIQTSAIFMCKI